MLLSDLLNFFTTVRWRERSKEIKLETPVCGRAGRTEVPTLQATALTQREGHFPRNAPSAHWAFSDHGLPDVSFSDPPFMASYSPNHPPRLGHAILPGKTRQHTPGNQQSERRP